MPSIEVARTSGSVFRVTIVDRGTTTTHLVTVGPEDAERYAPGVEVDRLVRASFEFLLEREPKESILARFELPVIERYFPDYPSAIRGVLR